MQTPIQYIREQSEDRQATLEAIHNIIIASDKTVTASVEPMMGKEMILYKCNGVMKYGLAAVKKYLTLHALPIYGSKVLFDRYQALLPNAVFQKGCINFNSAGDMPPGIVEQLIKDCAPYDLARMREEYMKNKKATPKK